MPVPNNPAESLSGDSSVDYSRPTITRWIVLGIVAFAASSAYLTRHCISAANSAIQDDLGFNNEQMGWMMSAFSLGYLFFQIPSGWLGNRFGSRFTFAFISIVWSLCNVWTAAVSGQASIWAGRTAEIFASMRTFQFFGFHPFGYLPPIPAETIPMLSSRFSLGIFQAGLTPISSKIIKDWIPLRHRGISSACIGACMSLGGAFTMWLTGWLLEEKRGWQEIFNYGWRGIFNAYSLVGIVWAIGFYWFFRTYPKDHKSVNEAELDLILDVPHTPLATTETTDAPSTETPNRDVEPHPSASELNGSELFISMLCSRSLWGLCVQAFFRAAGYAFFVTWFFNYLEKVYGISKANAGFLTSLPLLAVVVGTTFGGVIVDLLLRRTGSKWISRSGTAFVALMICGFITMASAWTSAASGLAIVIAVGAMFSGIGGPAAWAATIDVGGRHPALFVGTMNMGGCVAGVVLPTVLGKWFDHIEATNGDWKMVIYLHSAFYFAGALAWLAVNPNDTPTEPKTA
jgi:MFS family permease